MSVWKWEMVQTLECTLISGVNLPLIFAKIVEYNDLKMNKVMVRMTVNQNQLKEWANLVFENGTWCISARIHLDAWGEFAFHFHQNYTV